ncbi:ABC transporter substrate-binding protein [Pelagibacterium montanilacus]|uniref:ABC transporter substrate-binding protein n=1 Tax=Pelagibacterium montanilacus TaxID=2185280 RepID=UPI001FEAB10E|nr:ABC transporter substrate-binding protein [Pelagibacterium montanilacus]
MAMTTLPLPERCRRLALVGLTLGLALMPGAAAAEPFRLIVTHLEPPLVPNSVMDLALELGYFEREGVEVELVRVQQTPSALAALQAGQGEMANIGVDALLLRHAQGDDSLVAVGSPNTSLPFLIAARDDFGSVAKLAGASFGVGRLGSLDHSLSTRVLSSLGADPDAMEIVALGQPAVRAQALAAGRIDATTVSIGVWLSLPDKTGMEVLVDPDAYFAAAPVVNKVNVVPRTVLEDRRDEVEAVTAALVAVSRDFAADPDLWIEAMAPYGGELGPEDFGTLADAFAGAWMVNGGLDAQALAFTGDWLAGTEDFADAEMPTLDQWVDFSAVDAVLDRLGTAPGGDEPNR